MERQERDGLLRHSFAAASLFAPVVGIGASGSVRLEESLRQPLVVGVAGELAGPRPRTVVPVVVVDLVVDRVGNINTSGDVDEVAHHQVPALAGQHHVRELSLVLGPPLHAEGHQVRAGKPGAAGELVAMLHDLHRPGEVQPGAVARAILLHRPLDGVGAPRRQADVGVDEDDHVRRLAGLRHRLLHHVVDEGEGARVAEVTGGPGDFSDVVLHPAGSLQERLPRRAGEGVAALRVGAQGLAQGVRPDEDRRVGDRCLRLGLRGRDLDWLGCRLLGPLHHS